MKKVFDEIIAGILEIIISGMEKFLEALKGGND